MYIICNYSDWYHCILCVQ